MLQLFEALSHTFSLTFSIKLVIALIKIYSNANLFVVGQGRYQQVPYLELMTVLIFISNIIQMN